MVPLRLPMSVKIHASSMLENRACCRLTACSGTQIAFAASRPTTSTGDENGYAGYSCSKFGAYKSTSPARVGACATPSDSSAGEYDDETPVRCLLTEIG